MNSDIKNIAYACTAHTACTPNKMLLLRRFAVQAGCSYLVLYIFSLQCDESDSSVIFRIYCFVAGDKLPIPFAHFFVLCVIDTFLWGAARATNKQRQNGWTKRFHYNKSFSIQRKSSTCSYLRFLFFLFFSFRFFIQWASIVHCALFMPAFEENEKKNCCRKNRLVSFVCANFFVYLHTHTRVYCTRTHTLKPMKWNGII